MEGFYTPLGDSGFRHKPNAHAFHNWYSGPFEVNTDPTGFRVGKDSLAAIPKDVDILVIGDSQAFGQGVDFEQSLIGQFQSRAAKAGLTVANAAVGGHFLRNQAELCQWLARDQGVRPRLILVALTPRLLGNADAYSSVYVHDGALFDHRPSRGVLIRKWLSAHSAVYIVARNAMRRASAEQDRAGGMLEFYRTQLEHDAALDAISRRIRDIRDSFAPTRPNLAFCYLPLAAEHRIDELAASAGISADAAVPRRITARLAAEAQAPFIDLAPVIAQLQGAKEPITLDGDAHYNARTSEAVGRALWEGTDWGRAAGRP
jgi:hypothetical protein